jgi:hypothetical protein
MRVVIGSVKSRFGIALNDMTVPDQKKTTYKEKEATR